MRLLLMGYDCAKQKNIGKSCSVKIRQPNFSVTVRSAKLFSFHSQFQDINTET